MKYNKISNYKQEDKNPFTDSLKMTISKKNIVAGRSSNDVIVDTETGEQSGSVAFIKIQEYEKEQFVKFYVDNLRMFFDLSRKAIRVLAYIMQALKPRKDIVYIDLTDCSEFTKYAKSTILNGISELLENEFIARTKMTNMYYINPSIFFNGSRVNFIKQFKLKNDQKISLSDELDKDLSKNLLE